MDSYISRKDFLEKIKISVNTLIKLRKNGEIETITIGKKKYYNINKFLLDRGITKRINNKRRNISYCRVSSSKQKEDLIRQIKYVKRLYPKNIIISEIASGMNNKRKGLLKILDYAIKGELNELVITYKDRLSRFGFELIENIIKKYSKGKVIILGKRRNQTMEDELVDDILGIMNVYVAKINGIRSHKMNKIKK